jgi:hypothetical protein
MQYDYSLQCPLPATHNIQGIASSSSRFREPVRKLAPIQEVAGELFISSSFIQNQPIRTSSSQQIALLNFGVRVNLGPMAKPENGKLEGILPPKDLAAASARALARVSVRSSTPVSPHRHPSSRRES